MLGQYSYYYNNINIWATSPDETTQDTVTAEHLRGKKIDRVMRLLRSLRGKMKTVRETVCEVLLEGVMMIMCSAADYLALVSVPLLF